MKKIGLVGCGVWGKNILRDLLSLGCQVFVTDHHPQNNITALEMGAAGFFINSDDFPACDGYIVAVPIPELAPVCSRLLKYKKPIFAEKTLCLTLEMADELENLGGNEYIFAMHKWHYHPGIEALRVVAQSGRIGQLRELFSIRHGWNTDFHGGDIFWAWAIHDLTIVKHIFGFIPGHVSNSNIIRAPDGLPVSVTAILGKGPVANLLVNGRHAEKITSVSIHGEKGSALLRDAYDSFILVKDENGQEKIPIDITFPLFLELKEFVEYLLGGPAPRCGLNEAREMTRIILKLKQEAVTI
jgi:predicted dehydrogenase